MRFVVCCVLITLSFQAKCLEIEGEFIVGDAPHQIVVVGTAEFSRVRPVFSGFVAEYKDLQIRYLQMSSREIDRAVRSGLSPEIDLVMSSAVDLQVRLVNDGYAKAFEPGLAVDFGWRGELVQLSLEPVVTIFNGNRLGDFGGVRTRRDLAQFLDQSSESSFRLTLYDPDVSGVGYLLSRQDLVQDEHFWSLLDVFSSQQLEPNCCSGDMIDQVITGESDLAYNVLESYVLPRLGDAPDLKILRFDDYQLAIPRTAFIPKQADDSGPANELVRYFVSKKGQNRLAPGVRLDVIQANRQGGPIKPIRITPALIVHLDEMNRRRFFQRWNRSVRNP
jgi:iron(III) transport system substrate-binding protein